MFIFWHFETSASMEVTSPSHSEHPSAGMPPIWICTGQDTYKSTVLLENTRQSSGFLRSSRSAQTDLKETKTRQVKQHNAGGYKTRRVSTDLCSLKNVQWPLTAHVCASVSPSAQEHISQAVL